MTLLKQLLKLFDDDSRVVNADGNEMNECRPYTREKFPWLSPECSFYEEILVKVSLRR